jgi:hypothetical protein
MLVFPKQHCYRYSMGNSKPFADLVPTVTVDHRNTSNDRLPPNSLKRGIVKKIDCRYYLSAN